MDQQEISRETVARLTAEKDASTDPAHVAALEAQIRLHGELAGPEPETKPAKATRASKPSEA